LVNSLAGSGAGEIRSMLKRHLLFFLEFLP